MLNLNNITVTLGTGTQLERSIINNLSLTVRPGEFVTIIGGNGAGKSSLLSLISGRLHASSGSILIDGKDVTARTTHQRAPLIASVLQDPRTATLDNMSIEENLSFALLRGQQRLPLPHHREERLALFRTKLAPLGMGLEDRLEQLANSLSGGQRQALSLVMATLADAKLLLLDEHTAALDPKMAQLIMRITASIVQSTGLTTLMVTHSMADALAYGSRTIMLSEGTIVRDLQGGERAALTPTELVSFFM